MNEEEDDPVSLVTSVKTDFHGSVGAFADRGGTVNQTNIYHNVEPPHEKTLEALFPHVDPQPSYDLAREKARKLEPGTRKRLMGRLRDACARNPCSVLLADAGMGKSCVMGALAAEHYPALNKDCCQTATAMNVAAIHFFRYTDDTQRTIEECVLSLAKQLCEGLPSLRNCMPAKTELERIMSRVSSAHNKARFLLSELILKPCRKLDSPPSKKMVMMIDALDECEDSDALTIAIQELWAAGEDDIALHQAPPWLVLLVSSRNDDLAKTHFGAFQHLLMAPKYDENLDDIRTFVDERMRLWNVTQKEDVSRAIVEKTTGVFLWLEYKEKELKKLAKDHLLTVDVVLRDLPDGLPQVYRDYFGRIRTKLRELPEKYPDLFLVNDSRMDNLYRKSIAIGLLAPREAIPEIWWKKCLEFGDSLEETEAYEALRNIFSKLLIFDDRTKTIRVPHKSMVDFITFSSSDAPVDQITRSLQVELLMEHHVTLGRTLHTVFDDLTHSHSFRFGEYASETRYALTHVVYHLTKALRVDDALSCYLTLSKLMRICDVARMDENIGRLIGEAESLIAIPQKRSTKLQFCMSVLRLASRALAIDVRMLPGQILGRLGYPPYDDDQTHFESQAEEWLAENRRRGGYHVARPMHNWFSGLDFAGGSLERTWHLDNDVRSVAIGRNGEVCVTDGKVVRLYERKTGRMLMEYNEDSGEVTSVAISNDSKWIVTGSDVKTARLWNLESGKTERVFVGHSDIVTSVAISHDAKWIVTGSSDKTARLWNSQGGEEVKIFEGHSRGVTSAAISVDAKWIVTGSWDWTARLWNLESGNEARVFSGTNMVYSVAISNDSKWIVTGSDDKIARLWNLESGNEERAFTGHSREVASVAISKDMKWVVTGSDDKTARLWNLRSGEEERVFSGHSRQVNCVSISDDSKWIVTGSDDKTARLWNLQCGKRTGPRSRYLREVISVAISNDSKWIVTGSWDWTARLWNLKSGMQERVFKGHSSRVNSVAISIDSKWIVTGSEDTTARLWNLQSGKEEKVYSGHSGGVASVAISPDSKWIVTGSGDKTVRLWTLTNGVEVRVFRGNLRAVTSVAISNDSKWIVNGSWDNTARLWNLESGEEERVFSGQSSRVTTVAITSDSKWVLIRQGLNAHDNPFVFDVGTGERVSLSEYFQSVSRLCFPGESYCIMGKAAESVGFVLDTQANWRLIDDSADLVYTVSTLHHTPVCWRLS